MNILNPNTGQGYVPILKQHLYIMVTDFEEKLFLKEIKIGPGQHTWQWISFKVEKFVDISGINGNYCTFDNAINRAVNNPYCTVYAFDSFGEMVNLWLKVKYIDSIETVYKSEEE